MAFKRRSHTLYYTNSYLVPHTTVCIDDYMVNEHIGPTRRHTLFGYGFFKDTLAWHDQHEHEKAIVRKELKNVKMANFYLTHSLGFVAAVTAAAATAATLLRWQVFDNWQSTDHSWKMDHVYGR